MTSEKYETLAQTASSAARALDHVLTIRQHEEGIRRAGASVLIAIVAVFGAASAHSQDIPRNEVGFTDYVAARLQQEVGEGEGPAPTVVVKAPLTLGVGDFEAQLQRLFALCNANAGGCGFEIERYVRGAARACCGAAPPK